MTWTWIPPWRRKKTEPARHIVLYTRHGCHLCDDAAALLEPARAQHGFTLETVDIDSDPELTVKYGECVPVVIVDGKERFRGRINLVLLRRLFL